MKNIAVIFVVAALWSTIKADYIAAVVEYGPLSESSPNLTVENNLNEYIHYIEMAKRSSVQIIVFPEYGLTGMVDDPTDYAIKIPSVNSGNMYQNEWLQRLSNAAFEHRMYLVVNLLEKDTDENNKTIYYNTNIAFDKSGVIVAKYRKINLFLEPNLTPGNEIVTFTTDFGITFGIFTCFDILYYNPSRQIFNTSLTDVIYPAAWTSTLPFYHSLSIQWGYALGNHVNLLAANLNVPSRGIGGSGIYGYDGAILSYYISGTNSSKLLTGKLVPRGVPRETDVNPFVNFGFDILDNSTIQQSDLRNFVTSRDFDSSKYTFRDLDLSRKVDETVCHNSLCCKFSLSPETAASAIYKLVVYNGPSNLGGTSRNIKVCSVIACETSDLNSCGSRNISLTNKFTEILIEGNYGYDPEHFYQPVTLTPTLLPISNTSFSSVRINETIIVTYNTTRTVENVVVFGIFGRGAASHLQSSFIILIALSILKYLL